MEKELFVPQKRTQLGLLELSLHLCFPKSEFVVSSCPRAAFETLAAKTLGTKDQPSSANAKLSPIPISNLRRD